MATEYCIGAICFYPLDPNAQKFFGFSEFIAGLALMVLAWTNADIRYRFRIRTAPVPLQRITFIVVTALGLLTLLTDLWRAQGWLVPRGGFLTPESWQALLGAVFLLSFLGWAWFAFIRPPIYGKLTAERFARALYHVIVKGSPVELAVIADELADSAKALIQHAPNRDELRDESASANQEPSKKLSEVAGLANDILLLIADKRFCRAIVESSPGTAWSFFTK